MVLVDVRVCFVGDSFVAGVGDREYLGWTGRLAARTPFPLTTYGLGVRRQTSAQILARWRGECEPRTPTGVVVSFGVNDTTIEDGASRVSVQESVENLRGLATDSPWPLLVVGPPAVDDEQQNDRSAVLDEGFVQVCREAGVPYVPVLASLRADEVWRREVRDGDGAHPGAAGYAHLADLVAPFWRPWVHRLAYP
jgi:acyl-CoA thioesterase I